MDTVFTPPRTPPPRVALSIRPMVSSDWPSVEEIYKQGIATGNSTFDLHPPVSWDAFIASRLPHFCFVATPAGSEQVLGWVTASAMSTRACYAGIVDHSLYIGEAAWGKGVATALMRHLITSTEEQGMWSIQTLIFTDNQVSINLHKKLGFEVVGVRKKMGYMTFGPYKDTWRDCAFLERRSTIAGV